MKDVEWAPGERVSLRWEGSGDPLVVLAHGAGTNQDHPAVAALRRALAAAGLAVVTFNYPYTEAGKRRPDPLPRLLACHRAVVAAVGGERPILAGRSMGGRLATYLAADGVTCRAVVAYAYPLHPAGRPDRLRADHLAAVVVPMLFFRGTRDALSRADLFDRLVRPLPTATVVDLEGADHGFRGKGWTPERVAETLAAGTAAWLGAVR